MIEPMNHSDELLQRFASVARQDSPPLISKIGERLPFHDDDTSSFVGEVLSEAWMLGAHTGQTDVMAQRSSRVPRSSTACFAPEDQD